MSRVDINNYEAFLLDYAEGNLGHDDLAELKAFVLLHPELNIDLDNLSLPYFSEEDTSFEFKKDLLKKDDELSALDFRIISYLEGLADEHEKTAFEKELKENQELAAQFLLYSKTKLKANPAEEFSAKEDLLKIEELLNNTALLYSEGLLAGSEKQEAERNMRSNKMLAAEVKAFNATKSIPDASVTYPDKEELKKKTRVIALFSTRTLVTAAAAVLLVCGLAVLFNYLSTEGSAVQHQTADHKKDSINGTIKNKNKITSPERNPVRDIETSVKENKMVARNSSANSINEKIKGDSDSAAVEPKRTPQNIEIPLLPQNEMAGTKKNIPPTIIENAGNSDSSLAQVSPPQKVSPGEKFTRYTDLAYEEDAQEEVVETAPGKNGFWKRAVKFAQGVNVLGFKAVSGEEKSKDNYVLSFNSLSIEKK